VRGSAYIPSTQARTIDSSCSRTSVVKFCDMGEQ
jgi:hypothetical protein